MTETTNDPVASIGQELARTRTREAELSQAFQQAVAVAYTSAEQPSLSELAERSCQSHETIRKALIRQGVKLRPRGGPNNRRD